MTIEHITNAINKALANQSDINTDIYNVRGFSTPTMRRLFHELTNLERCTYLEVGLYCGATFVSSFNKGCFSIGIENFSQPFGVESVEWELKENVHRFLSNSEGVSLHNADCFLFDINQLPLIDIYFFDGEHSEESQAKALPYYLNALNDTFIFIVDDYNWESVRKGTEKGLAELSDKIEIVKDWKIRGLDAQDDEIWHNGVYVALINKK